MSGHFCLGSHDVTARENTFLATKGEKDLIMVAQKAFFVNCISILFSDLVIRVLIQNYKRKQIQLLGKLQILKNVASVELCCVTGN